MTSDLSDQKKSELCLTCGRCCSKIYAYMPEAEDLRADMMQREFFKARGLERLPMLDRPGYRAYSIPSRCPHLQSDNKCDIYEKRPLACKKYDGTRDPYINCAWREEEV